MPLIAVGHEWHEYRERARLSTPRFSFASCAERLPLARLRSSPGAVLNWFIRAFDDVDLDPRWHSDNPSNPAISHASQKAIQGHAQLEHFRAVQRAVVCTPHADKNGLKIACGDDSYPPLAPDAGSPLYGKDDGRAGGTAPRRPERPTRHPSPRRNGEDVVGQRREPRILHIGLELSHVDRDEMVWRLSRRVAEVGLGRCAPLVLKHEYLAVAVYVRRHIPVVGVGGGRCPNLSWGKRRATTMLTHASSVLSGKLNGATTAKLTGHRRSGASRPLSGRGLRIEVQLSGPYPQGDEPLLSGSLGQPRRTIRGPSMRNEVGQRRSRDLSQAAKEAHLAVPERSDNNGAIEEAVELLAGCLGDQAAVVAGGKVARVRTLP